MLDPDNIEKLLKSLPMKNMDSIWIGKMNHISRISVDGNDDLRVALAKLEKSQSDENILRIYDQWKSAPRIRWKESIQKVINKS